eukprot:CAMPEP_0172518688 /NCGR_PEP_ID=MMETSP1066-20121228/290968_1 /TAXON_ID=671091 /ORGANISM="Coscinodiscus wailesii, Strain CCMP2513" /LENGTH=852 /DNA_ID=CAMNT_0013301125 /DNA_START=388 /DNA_END=2947 /DNA_ORIENTATION=-
MIFAFAIGVAFGPDAPPPPTTFNELYKTLATKCTSKARRLPPPQHIGNISVLPLYSNGSNERYEMEQLHITYDEPTSLYQDTNINVSSSFKAINDSYHSVGEHLLVDIRSIPNEDNFLTNEEHLIDAFKGITVSKGMHLGSYACHHEERGAGGLSCGMLFLEGHVSFHTLPEEGMVSIDMYAFGSDLLLSILAALEESGSFGVNKLGKEFKSCTTCDEKERDEEYDDNDVDSGDEEEDDDDDDEDVDVKTYWSHKLRGYRSYENNTRAHYLDNSDLAEWVIIPLDLKYKKEVASVQTPYQRIDIWDMIEHGDTPGWDEGLKLGLEPGDSRWMADDLNMIEHGDTPGWDEGLKLGLEPGDSRWMADDLTFPERLLFLDGAYQTHSDSEHECHEAHVHPAMFTHPNPVHVAIIGGGDGAILREVLKHDTVTHVTMIEIDQMMIDVSRQYLPLYSDCGHIANSTKSCFDDPRVQLLISDAHDWFLEHYGSNDHNSDNDDNTGSFLFDVVLIDVLDPEESDSLSDKIYTDPSFLDALYSSMSPSGVISIRAGKAPSIRDPKAQEGVNSRRERFFNMLERNSQTAAMHLYEEPSCGNHEVEAFLLVCKRVDCREGWYASTDDIDRKIVQRLRGTRRVEGGVQDAVRQTAVLVHYDGSTHYMYQYPPKAWETVYCRREPTPYECAFRGLDLAANIHNLGTGLTLVEKNSGGSDSNVSTMVFATREIQKGDYIMAFDLASSLFVSKQTQENLKSYSSNSSRSFTVINELSQFINDRAHLSLTEGHQLNVVEMGGSAFIRIVHDAIGANVDRLRPIPKDMKQPPFSPVFDRHRYSFDVFLVATRDIKTGEEILKYEQVWE